MRHGERKTQDADPLSREIGKLWSLAEVQSQRDLSASDYARRAWALGNLIELYLLAPAIDEVSKLYANSPESLNWGSRAVHYARELAKITMPKAFEVFSTRRQIVRYLDLYIELAPGKMEQVADIAEQIVNLLPAQPPEDVS